MKKFLIAGLGNPGEEYAFTRHNIGFLIADALAVNLQKEDPPLSASRLFHSGKLAWHAEMKYRGKTVVIIKPSTFMNLSGKAVSFWMQHENIEKENVLVVADDLALPFGTLRLKKKGGAGGHNGLTDIIATLQSEEYPRLRFGIGSNFAKGRQSEHVLGAWEKEETALLGERIDKAVSLIKSFLAIGVDRAMSDFNNK
jgi:PTH1 family peptidyl-tRNA hydrolase